MLGREMGAGQTRGRMGHLCTRLHPSPPRRSGSTARCQMAVFLKRFNEHIQSVNCQMVKSSLFMT